MKFAETVLDEVGVLDTGVASGLSLLGVGDVAVLADRADVHLLASYLGGSPELAVVPGSNEATFAGFCVDPA